MLLLASPPKTYHTLRPFIDGQVATLEDLRAMMAASSYQGYTWRQLRLLWEFDPGMSDRLAEYNVQQALFATGTKFAKLAAAGFDPLIQTWIPAIEGVQADIRRRGLQEAQSHGRDQVHGRTAGTRIPQER
jgi:hypothetical protein